MTKTDRKKKKQHNLQIRFLVFSDQPWHTINSSNSHTRHMNLLCSFRGLVHALCPISALSECLTQWKWNCFLFYFFWNNKKLKSKLNESIMNFWMEGKTMILCDEYEFRLLNWRKSDLSLSIYLSIVIMVSGIYFHLWAAVIVGKYAKLVWYCIAIAIHLRNLEFDRIQDQLMQK